MYEFFGSRFHLINRLDCQRRMDGTDHSLNEHSCIDCDNLDFWYLPYPEQLVLEDPFGIASSAIDSTGFTHLVCS